MFVSAAFLLLLDGGNSPFPEAPSVSIRDLKLLPNSIHKSEALRMFSDPYPRTHVVSNDGKMLFSTNRYRDILGIQLPDAQNLVAEDVLCFLKNGSPACALTDSQYAHFKDEIQGRLKSGTLQQVKTESTVLSAVNATQSVHVVSVSRSKDSYNSKGPQTFFSSITTSRCDLNSNVTTPFQPGRILTTALQASGGYEFGAFPSPNANFADARGVYFLTTLSPKNAPSLALQIRYFSFGGRSTQNVSANSPYAKWNERIVPSEMGGLKLAAIDMISEKAYFHDRKNIKLSVWDFRKEKAKPIPMPNFERNSYYALTCFRGRLFAHSGTTLQKEEVRGLYEFDRKQNRWFFRGRYGIAGISPNQRFMVVFDAALKAWRFDFGKLNFR